MGRSEREWRVFESEVSADELARELVQALAGRGPDDSGSWLNVRTAQNLAALVGAAGVGIYALSLMNPGPGLWYSLVLGVAAMFFLMWVYLRSFYARPQRRIADSYLREASESPHSEMYAYAIGISEDSLALMLGGQPVELLEWVEVTPFGDRDRSSGKSSDRLGISKLPLSPSVSLLFEMGDVVDSVELKQRPMTPVRLDDINAVYRHGWDLEIVTRQGRSLHIPNFFPTPEIYAELSEKLPRSVML